MDPLDNWSTDFNSSKDIGQSAVGNWPHWLRWILVIPASALGALIASVLVNLLNSSSGDGSVPVWSQIISSGVLGFTFVYFAAAMAPKHQLEIGVVFLVLLSLLLGMLWMSARDQNLWVTGGAVAYNSLHFLISLAGAIIAIFSIKEQLE